MPIYEIEANGKVYEVEAPDQASALGAIKPAPDKTMDVAKSAGVGVAKGAIGLAGLPGDVRTLAGAATDWVGGKLGASQESIDALKSGVQRGARLVPGLNAFAGAPTSQEIQKGVEGVTGEFYKPQTMAGEYAQTAGEFLPAAAAGPGGIARRLAVQAAAPAALSETAGQLTKGSAAEPYARVGGALAAPAAMATARRLVTPLPNTPERQAAVELLRGEGVDLTAGQATGRKRLQYFEAERGSPAVVERQGEQFTAAALRRTGENANRATPEVIDNAFNRIGNQFDTLAARHTAAVDQQLAADVRASVDNYNNLVSPPNRTPAVANFVQELATAAQRNGGQIPGDVYQSLRSRMERAARGMGNNPEARTAIRDVREALDEAMERSIARSGVPDDLGAWREARRQYRNLLVVERAATGAGENAALGIISPAQLRQATVNVQGRRNYARGDGDFADLARAGVGTMTPLPNSGTPGRLLAQNMGATIGSAIGGATGFAAGGPIGIPLGTIAGAAMPSVMGRAATSRAGRAYLSNQLLHASPEEARRIARMLLAPPAAQQAIEARGP